MRHESWRVKSQDMILLGASDILCLILGFKYNMITLSCLAQPRDAISCGAGACEVALYKQFKALFHRQDAALGPIHLLGYPVLHLAACGLLDDPENGQAHIVLNLHFVG